MTGASQNVLAPNEANYPPDRTLRFTRTDFNSSRYKFPSNTEERVNEDGIYDFMKRLGPLDQSHFDWRRKVGTYIADVVDKKLITSLAPHKDGYILEDFPHGYEFYDHHKGPPGGRIRHDLYLFGPDNSAKFYKFRSVNEFIPHAIWLYDVASLEPCKCKYCTGAKSQRLISEAMLGQTHSTPRSSSVSKPPRPRMNARKQAEKDDPKNIYPSEIVSTELHNDLRSRRSFRKGELVWGSLDPPIRDEYDPELALVFWPGIIVDCHLVIRVEDDVDGANDPVQEHAYTVEFLAVSQAHYLLDKEILPHQAYILDSSLSLRVHNYHPPPISPDLSEFAKFKPLQQSYFDEAPSPAPPTFSDALVPFVYALKINENLVSYYRPFSSWKYHGPDVKHLHPSNSLSKSPKTSAPQDRYQGFWWGAEKIWMGDLVRMKPEKDQFPTHIQSLFRPSPDTSYAASRRLIFLRIESIFKESEDSAASAGSAHFKVSGRLYETVPEDWVEPDEPDAQQSPSSQSISNITNTPPVESTSNFAASNALSGPSSVYLLGDMYPLPKPPPGFQWRLFTKPGIDLSFPMPLIAGRYYPDLLLNPLVNLTAEDLQNALKGESKADIERDNRIALLLSLGGLEKGWINSMSTRYYVRSRKDMLRKAEEKAKNAVREIYGSSLPPPTTPRPWKMDIS